MSFLDYMKMETIFNPLLKEMALRLLSTAPSEVDDSDVINIEGTLNDLYQNIILSNVPSKKESENVILNILGLAGQLSSLSKMKPKGERDMNFFTGVKRLGKSLLILEFILEDFGDADSTM